MSVERLRFGLPVNACFKQRKRIMAVTYIYEVIRSFEFNNDNTFPNAVMLMDAFFAKQFIEMSECQFYALCFIWISTKLHEVECMGMDSLICWCAPAGHKTKEQFQEAERIIIQVLDGHLLYENPLDTISVFFYSVENRSDIKIYQKIRNMSYRCLFNKKYQQFYSDQLGMTSLVLVYLWNNVESELLTIENIKEAERIRSILKLENRQNGWFSQHLNITC